MASRDPKHLHPDLLPLFEAFMEELERQGVDALCTCTYRSNAEQDKAFAQGRTVRGNIVTRARGGQSAHNFTINGVPASKAFDMVPLEHGKPVWDVSHPAWQTMGAIGAELGLNWYGSPGSVFREYPHFQLKE